MRVRLRVRAARALGSDTAVAAGEHVRVADVAALLELVPQARRPVGARDHAALRLADDHDLLAVPERADLLRGGAGLAPDREGVAGRDVHGAVADLVAAGARVVDAAAWGRGHRARAGRANK